MIKLFSFRAQFSEQAKVLGLLNLLEYLCQWHHKEEVGIPSRPQDYLDIFWVSTEIDDMRDHLGLLQHPLDVRIPPDLGLNGGSDS